MAKPTNRSTIFEWYDLGFISTSVGMDINIIGREPHFAIMAPNEIILNCFLQQYARYWRIGKYGYAILIP